MRTAAAGFIPDLIGKHGLVLRQKDHGIQEDILNGEDTGIIQEELQQICLFIG